MVGVAFLAGSRLVVVSEHIVNIAAGCKTLGRLLCLGGGDTLSLLCAHVSPAKPRPSQLGSQSVVLCLGIEFVWPSVCMHALFSPSYMNDGHIVGGDCFLGVFVFVRNQTPG